MASCQLTLPLPLGLCLIAVLALAAAATVPEIPHARATRVRQSLLQPWPRTSDPRQGGPGHTVHSADVRKDGEASEARTEALLLGPVTKSNGVLTVEFNGVAPPGQAYPWYVCACDMTSCYVVTCLLYSLTAGNMVSVCHST